MALQGRKSAKSEVVSLSPTASRGCFFRQPPPSSFLRPRTLFSPACSVVFLFLSLVTRFSPSVGPTLHILAFECS